MMKIIGSKQRLLISAWTLATILIGGLNIYWLMALEQRPLAGYSQTIRTLKAKLTQFEKLPTAGTGSINTIGDLKGLFNPSSMDGRPDNDPSAPQAGSESQSHTTETAALPVLSGIMQITDPYGAVHFQALLDGRVCRKNDKIGEYSVEDIRSAGVSLRRSDGKWFLKSPSPFYSSDQGE